MGEVIIKGVGKKLLLKDGNIEIKKSIGKDLFINIKDIKDISFIEGTLYKNGSLYIKAIVNGEMINNSISFWYSQNGIVAQVVNYINDPNEDNSNISVVKTNLFQQIHNETNNIMMAKQEELQKLKQYDKDGIPYCPKCYSTSIHYIENRKRLSVGRTIVGGAVGSLINPIGTIAGAAMGGLTSNKQKKGTIKCLNCGHTWKK